MLSEGVREALQAELDSLRIRRKKVVERIDERISALEAVLAPDDELFGGGSRQMPLKEVATPVRAYVLHAGMSFRDHLRSVLAEHPNLSAPEVSAHIEARGVRPGGETPIGVRVANELFRMAQRGQLSKRKARYSLPTPTNEAATGAA